MSQEVYLNSDEINLFRQSSSHYSAENSVEFHLPNSYESGSFLQKVRLSRQFRKTLDSVRFQSELQDSGNSSVNDDSAYLEEILFEDENYERKRDILERSFAEWKSLVDIRKVFFYVMESGGLCSVIYITNLQSLFIILAYWTQLLEHGTQGT